MSAARKLYAADLFCGAGGTSTGMALACKELDRAVELLAINHWSRAIATHAKNHPSRPGFQTTHLCANLDTIDPRKVVPGGRLDLLVASPECTHHSTARGGRPMNDQSRASAFRVLEWCDKLDVANILIENVPEFENWGPIASSTQRPIKAKRGETFRQWVAMLEAMNYRVQRRVLNAADYGGVTTRKRLFIIARRRPGQIRWPEPTHSKDGSTDLFGTKKKWRAAKEIIDWSIKGKSIFWRKKPLAKSTLERIYCGLVKQGGESAAPLIWYLRRYIDRIYPPRVVTWEPTLFTAEMKVIGEEYVPKIYRTSFLTVLEKHRPGIPTEFPFPTITAGGNKIFLTEAFLLSQQSGGAPRSVIHPFSTISTKGAMSLTQFIVPFFGERRGQLPRSHSVHSPFPAVTSHGAGGLVDSFLLPNEGFYRHWQNKARSINLPLHTVTSRGAGGVVSFMITPGGADLGGARSVLQPVPTVMTYDRLALVSSRPEPQAVPAASFLTQIANSGSGSSYVRSVDDPFHTVVTKAQIAMVEAYVIKVNHGRDADRHASVEKPLHAVTTKNGTALVQPFLVKFYKDPKTQHQSVFHPLHTITTKGRFGLVTADLSMEDPPGDILFRMMLDRELARAMGFENYHFTGSQEERIRQIGNAVEVNIAKALCKAILEN